MRTKSSLSQPGPIGRASLGPKMAPQKHRMASKGASRGTKTLSKVVQKQEELCGTGPLRHLCQLAFHLNYVHLMQQRLHFIMVEYLWCCCAQCSQCDADDEALPWAADEGGPPWAWALWVLWVWVDRGGHGATGPLFINNNCMFHCNCKLPGCACISWQLQVHWQLHTLLQLAIAIAINAVRSLATYVAAWLRELSCAGLFSMGRCFMTCMSQCFY